jgi:hypothetical protein
MNQSVQNQVVDDRPEPFKLTWWHRAFPYVVTLLLILISWQLLIVVRALEDMQRSAHTHSAVVTDITGVPEAPSYVRKVPVQDPNLCGYRTGPFYPMDGYGQLLVGSYTSEQKAQDPLAMGPGGQGEDP